MKSSEQKGQNNSDRKTKAQLQKALSNAHSLLDEQDKELAALKKELNQLKGSKTKNGSSESEQKELASTKAELEQVLEDLEEMNEQAKQLKQEIEELRRINQEIQEEKESLLNQLQDVKNDNKLKEIESLQKQLKAAEQRIQHLENKVIELEKINAELEDELTAPEPSEETIPKDISATKATFRVDLYPHQDHFQGKIEHLLTKDKKVFNELDGIAIIDFITEHLPRLEEQGVETQPVDAAQPESMSSKFPGLPKVIIDLPTDPKRPGSYLQHGQSFQVQLTIDPTNVIVGNSAALGYKIVIYAKQLGGGSTQIIGEVHGEINSASEFPTNVVSTALPPGTYRLEAIGTFNFLEEKPTSIGDFHESRIINVL